MEYFFIIISAIFVNNILLSQFLGVCPFLGVSSKLDTAVGMSGAVCFVITLATVVTFLLNKLKPSVATQATVLGNLAGKFLDEALCHSDSTYQQSVRQFFSEQALNLLTAHDGCERLLPCLFRRNGRKIVIQRTAVFLLPLLGLLNIIHRIVGTVAAE